MQKSDQAHKAFNEARQSQTADTDAVATENPFGLQAILEIQRKNFQAFTDVNRNAMQGWQTLVRRQMDMTSRMFQGGTDPSVKDATDMPTPAGMAAYTKVLSNAGEMASLVQTCTMENASMLNRRALACLAEIRNAAKASTDTDKA